MTMPREYGPFVHQLNKGGLREIAISQKMRGAVGANQFADDKPAVRAYVGSFEAQKANKRWSGRTRIYLEFMTFTPLRTGLSPGYAEWSGDALVDGHLQIRLLRVINGEGEPVLC